MASGDRTGPCVDLRFALILLVLNQAVDASVSSFGWRAGESSIKTVAAAVQGQAH